MTTRMMARIVFVAVAIAALAACKGGGGGVPGTGSSALSGVQPYSGPSSLSFTWSSPTLEGATYMGPATISGKILLNIQPQLQNEEGLLQYAASTAVPGSANYRHWLTPAEIGERYGASQSAINADMKYFAGYGLSAGTWPQHLMIAVMGSQSEMESAFGTKFGVWQVATPTGPVKVFGPEPSASPHFTKAIPVMTVMGLVGFRPYHTYIERPADVQGYGYTAPVIRNGFDYIGPISAGYGGSGVTIGIIGTGPIVTGTSGDVAGYAELSGLSSTDVGTVVIKDVKLQSNDSEFCPSSSDCEDPNPAGLSTPPPATAPCSSSVNPDGPGIVTEDPACNEEDGEAQLDTEMTAGMAPHATIDFYLAYNGTDCAAQYFDCASGWTGTGTPVGVEGIYLVDDEVQQAIADDVVDVLSMSYGAGEQEELNFYFNSSGDGPGPDEFAALASEGVTIFAASGDNGAYGCDSGGMAYGQKCVSYPASDPSVIGVGGVNAPFTNSGQLQPGTEITAWASNTTYGGDGYDDNSSGTGGGQSLYFAAPSWQSAVTSASKREVPDISLLADPETGPMLVEDWSFSGDQAYGESGGTSAAAPLSAAMFADFLSACKENTTCSETTSGSHGYRWGLAAVKAFYSIAQSEAGADFAKQAECEGGVSGAFYDVCAGQNDTNSGGTIQAGYPSEPGYDMDTGLGVPFGGYLIDKLFSSSYCGTSGCGTMSVP